MDVRVERKNTSIMVKVLDSENNPKASVVVYPWSIEGGFVFKDLRLRRQEIWQRTDEEGRCLFDPIRPGSYRMVIDFGKWTQYAECIVAREGQRVEHTIVLLEMGELTGTVKDLEGNPVSSIFVYFRFHEGAKNDDNLAWERIEYEELADGWFAGTRTDEEGRFHLTNLPMKPGFLLVDGGAENF